MPYPIEVNSNIEGASVSRTRRKLGYETRLETGKCEINQTANLRLKTSGEINTMAATSISTREIGRTKKIEKLPLEIIND